MCVVLFFRLLKLWLINKFQRRNMARNCNHDWDPYYMQTWKCGILCAIQTELINDQSQSIHAQIYNTTYSNSTDLTHTQKSHFICYFVQTVKNQFILNEPQWQSTQKLRPHEQLLSIRIYRPKILISWKVHLLRATRHINWTSLVFTATYGLSRLFSIFCANTMSIPWQVC